MLVLFRWAWAAVHDGIGSSGFGTSPCTGCSRREAARVGELAEPRSSDARVSRIWFRARRLATRRCSRGPRPSG